MSIKALSDFRTDLLVCTNNVSEVFRIELGCQLGRFDEVDEHHGELATFRVWGMRCCWRRFALGRWLCLGSRLLSCQCGLRDGFLVFPVQPRTEPSSAKARRLGLIISS